MDGIIKSIYLKEFIKEITYHNRNPRDIKALELLDDISTNPEIDLGIDEKLYRARIVKNVKEIGKTKNFYGFDSKNSFVPSAELTSDMRANYRYIPYLYCSNSPYLSLVEVRPRFGAKVSIATICLKEPLHLLDFTTSDKPPKMSSAKVNLFNDLSRLFSKPVVDEDDTKDYIPTQFIAEYVKNLCYDGIVYTSSLVPEINEKIPGRYNIVVFNYHKCKPVKSNVCQITNNYMDCKQIDDDSEQLEGKSYVDALMKMAF